MEFTLDWDDFLANYWQKKPVVIKQAFKNFVDPITPEELAGLAMEEEVDSRLVTNREGAWNVQHGPFDSFDHLGDDHWSILVQAVNHWYEPARVLMQPFRQLPDWRIDDLMISYSTPGAGVGPHIDQYDVFIIQGIGKRLWRVGERKVMKEYCPHPDLLQVEPFDSILEAEMDSGDMLYIPPGFPHEGFSSENCLNYSVGFRAPNAKEMLSSFADYALANELGTKRYSDENLQTRCLPADVQAAEMAELKGMVQALLDSPEHFERCFGEFITAARHELDIAPPEPEFQAEEVYQLLKDGEPLERLSGLRVIRVGENVYVNGEPLETQHKEAANVLAQHFIVDADALGEAIEDTAFIALLTALVNSGYWFFND